MVMAAAFSLFSCTNNNGKGEASWNEIKDENFSQGFFQYYTSEYMKKFYGFHPEGLICYSLSFNNGNKPEDIFTGDTSGLELLLYTEPTEDNSVLPTGTFELADTSGIRAGVCLEGRFMSTKEYLKFKGQDTAGYTSEQLDADSDLIIGSVYLIPESEGRDEDGDGKIDFDFNYGFLKAGSGSTVTLTKTSKGYKMVTEAFIEGKKYTFMYEGELPNLQGPAPEAPGEE